MKKVVFHFKRFKFLLPVSLERGMTVHFAFLLVRNLLHGAEKSSYGGTCIKFSFVLAYWNTSPEVLPLVTLQDLYLTSVRGGEGVAVYMM